MKVSLNPTRLQYLLDLYAMSTEALLEQISRGLANPIKANEVSGGEIKVSHLKKIDKIFQKGLAFYLDPSEPPREKSSSIFFRKANLAAELNLGAKKIIDNFEEQQQRLTAYSKLVNLSLERSVKTYTTADPAAEAAKEVRPLLYPKGKTKDTKDFLTRLIARLSAQNIFVFEFVETWNKTDKANIDGAYIAPNTVVIKRNQQSLKREAFTLAHELGHYLLNEEEAEDVVFENNQHLSHIERWCNEFAFHFLIGDQYPTLMNSVSNGVVNDVKLEEISTYSHLSISALYTQLLIVKKINYRTYRTKIEAIQRYFQDQDELNKEQKQLDKTLGQEIGRASAPKPIRSPLHVTVLRDAFHEGLVNEMDFCKSLHIKAEAIDKYLYA